MPTDAQHTNYTFNRTVEWARPGGGGGCADGFKVLARPGHSTLLVAACPMGVCVVDAERTDEPVLEYVPFPSACGHRRRRATIAHLLVCWLTRAC